MLKTTTRNIDGKDVSVTQFAGRRNLSILVNLAKVAGPTIAAGVGSDGLDAQVDVGNVVNTLVTSLDEASVTKLVNDLLASTSIDGRPLDDAEFDRLFAGTGLMMLPKVLMYVVEVNFGNFSELAGAVSGVGGTTPAAPASGD